MTKSTSKKSTSTSKPDTSTVQVVRPPREASVILRRAQGALKRGRDARAQAAREVHALRTGGFLGKGCTWTSNRSLARSLDTSHTNVGGLLNLGKAQEIGVTTDDPNWTTYSDKAASAWFAAAVNADGATVETIAAAAAEAAKGKPRASADTGTGKDGGKGTDKGADKGTEKGAPAPRGVPAMLDTVESILRDLAGRTSSLTPTQVTRLEKIGESVAVLVETGGENKTTPTGARRSRPATSRRGKAA